MKKLIKARVINHFKKYAWINKNQFGFQSCKNTTKRFKVSKL